MDQDDPEKRIAELERQWADAQGATAKDHGAEHPGAPTSAAETTQHPALTAADIKKVAFSRPPIGMRGYNEDEVDAFLDLVEERLRNPSKPSLTAVDVQNMAFSKPPIGKRGYNEDEVDAFLDRVESELSRLDGTTGRLDVGRQYQPPPQPVVAVDGSLPGRSRWSTGIGGWLTAIVVAGIWLYMFGDLVWDVYGYQVGTPATATDVRCRGDTDAANVWCSGTWSVGGQSRNGPIHRVPENWKFGQPLDVRAHGGTAFAAGSTGWRLASTALFFLVVIAMSLGGFRALDRRWRRWRTRR